MDECFYDDELLTSGFRKMPHFGFINLIIIPSPFKSYSIGDRNKIVTKSAEIIA